LRILKDCREHLKAYFAESKIQLLEQRLEHLERELERFAARKERRLEQKAKELEDVQRLKQSVSEEGGEHPLKVKDHVEWLQLQPPSDQAEPQPWMQLAALLRTKGDDEGAKRIIFQLRCAQAKHAIKAMRAWKIVFARLQQQPLWVLVPIVLITSLAACLFWFASVRGAMVPTSKEAYLAWSTGSRMDAAYPQFNPLIYSLENDLPLVKFGLDDKWAPDQTYKPKDRVVSYGTLRWARVLLILCGWLQATVLAAAIGSRFKN
jgi:hypothetical protein